jgi:hypothetical protein
MKTFQNMLRMEVKGAANAVGNMQILDKHEKLQEKLDQEARERVAMREMLMQEQIAERRRKEQEEWDNLKQEKEMFALESIRMKQEARIAQAKYRRYNEQKEFARLQQMEYTKGKRQYIANKIDAMMEQRRIVKEKKDQEIDERLKMTQDFKRQENDIRKEQLSEKISQARECKRALDEERKQAIIRKEEEYYARHAAQGAKVRDQKEREREKREQIEKERQEREDTMRKAKAAQAKLLAERTQKTKDELAFKDFMAQKELARMRDQQERRRILKGIRQEAYQLSAHRKKRADDYIMQQQIDNIKMKNDRSEAIKAGKQAMQALRGEMMTVMLRTKAELKDQVKRLEKKDSLNPDVLVEKAVEIADNKMLPALSRKFGVKEVMSKTYPAFSSSMDSPDSVIDGSKMFNESSMQVPSMSQSLPSGNADDHSAGSLGSSSQSSKRSPDNSIRKAILRGEVVTHPGRGSITNLTLQSLSSQAETSKPAPEATTSEKYPNMPRLQSGLRVQTDMQMLGLIGPSDGLLSSSAKSSSAMGMGHTSAGSMKMSAGGMLTGTGQNMSAAMKSGPGMSAQSAKSDNDLGLYALGSAGNALTMPNGLPMSRGQSPKKSPMDKDRQGRFWPDETYDDWGFGDQSTVKLDHSTLTLPVHRMKLRAITMDNLQSTLVAAKEKELRLKAIMETEKQKKQVDPHFDENDIFREKTPRKSTANQTNPAAFVEASPVKVGSAAFDTERSPMLVSEPIPKLADQKARNVTMQSMVSIGDAPPQVVAALEGGLPGQVDPAGNSIQDSTDKGEQFYGYTNMNVDSLASEDSMNSIDFSVSGAVPAAPPTMSQDPSLAFSTGSVASAAMSQPGQQSNAPVAAAGPHTSPPQTAGNGVTMIQHEILKPTDLSNGADVITGADGRLTSINNAYDQYKHGESEVLVHVESMAKNGVDMEQGSGDASSNLDSRNQDSIVSLQVDSMASAGLPRTPGSRASRRSGKGSAPDGTFRREYSADHPLAGGAGKYKSEKSQKLRPLGPIPSNRSTKNVSKKGGAIHDDDIRQHLKKLNQSEYAREQAIDKMNARLAELKKRQSAEFLGILEEERLAELERSSALGNKTISENERRRLEMVFAEERKFASDRIIEVTKAHQKNIKQFMVSQIMSMK